MGLVRFHLFVVAHGDSDECSYQAGVALCQHVPNYRCGWE